MKSKLATGLSLIGVVVTGTAAAAVNTQALQSRAEATIGSSAVSFNNTTADSALTIDPALAPAPINTTKTETENKLAGTPASTTGTTSNGSVRVTAVDPSVSPTPTTTGTPMASPSARPAHVEDSDHEDEEDDD